MPTRRALLNQAGVSFSVGSLASLAGCTSAGSPSSSVSPPESRQPTYRNWLPEPRDIGRSNQGSYNVEYTSVDNLRSSADVDPEFVEFYLAPISKTWSFLGLADDEMTDVITIEDVDRLSGTIIRGTFDQKSVTTAIEAAGYSKEGAIRGYDHYHRSSPDRAIVVTDEAIVYARSQDANSMAESIIETRYGDGTAYHEASDDFELITDELGSQSVVKFGLREQYSTAIPEVYAFEGSRAHGLSRELTKSARYTQLVVPFLDEGAADVDAVRTVMEGDEFDSLNVYRDGRTVFVDGKTKIA